MSAADFLADVRARAAYLQHRLSTLESELIVEVRAAGLLVGVEMTVPVAPLMTAAREKGLLVINAGEMVLRLAPPLIVGQPAIDEAVTVLEQVIRGQS